MPSVVAQCFECPCCGYGFVTNGFECIAKCPISEPFVATIHAPVVAIYIHAPVVAIHAPVVAKFGVVGYHACCCGAVICPVLSGTIIWMMALNGFRICPSCG